MKKILTVLLIAVMAAGFVFAGVSGAAELDFGYNLAKKTFGFDASNSEVNFDFDLGTTAGAVAEGDVHAEVEAKVKLQFANELAAKKLPLEKTKHSGVYGAGVKADASWTAKIVGKNWSVALKTADYGYCGFASSAIDTYRKGVKSVFGDKYVGFAKTALALGGNWANDTDNYGVEVTAYDYKLGLVFDGSRTTSTDRPLTSYTDFKAYIATPEYAVDGFTAQFAGSIAYDKGDSYTTPTTVAETGERKTDTWTSPTTAIALSAKLGYAADKFAGSIASDVEIDATESKADFDIAVAASYDFVKFDGFFVNNLAVAEYDKNGFAKGYKDLADKKTQTVAKKTTEFKNYMSAKLAFDFAKFDVPVTFTVTGKNLLAIFNSTTASDSQLSYATGTDFKFEVAYTGLINASAYFEINTKDCYSLGLAASYDAAMFTVGAGFDYKYDKTKDAANVKDSFAGVAEKSFMPTVYVTTDKLVPGAVLSLGWYSNTNDTKSNCSNILSGSTDMGNITAKCVIAF